MAGFGGRSPVFYAALPLALSLALAGCQHVTEPTKTAPTLAQPAMPALVTDPLPFVDPFIGTDGKGKTYPGVTVPYGMVQLSPDNGRSGWDWISGYFYPDRQIAGFSHLHLSGTGAGDLYDISFLPFSVEHFEALPAAGGKPALVRTEGFSHDREQASPGYYQVYLQNSQINVELTAGLRTGYQRYQYPATGPARLQLDLTYSRNWDQTTATCLYQPDPYTLAGWRFSSGWATKQQVFFVSKSSVALLPDRPLPRQLPADSKDCAQSGPTLFRVDFAGGFAGAAEHPAAARELLLRTSLSSVSVEGAMANLAAEGDHSFDQALSRAQQQWRAELGQVQLAADPNTLTQFYTALYHSALAPRVYADADGRFRGPDGGVHQRSSHLHYDFFSLWDTFRALHPWKTLFDPPRNQAMLQSLLDHYDIAGRLPVWNFQGNETDMMLGYHAVPVLVDAYLKGLLPGEGERILKAALQSANDQQFGLASYRRLGFVPYDERKWNVSLALEYAFDDSAIARLATALGRQDVAAEFARRAQNYRLLFDPQSGFMRAKDAKGQFRLPFDARAYHPEDYCEANAWQYSFFVPHDVAGLAQLYGGNSALIDKIDAMFRETQQKAELKQVVTDNDGLPEWISGFIGQYVHGNEPSHHVPYLYSLLGRPDKTATLVRRIMTQLYQTTPDGLAGNEDAGQMSAWYLFSALGFYPLDPVSGDYVLGSPLVQAARLQLGNGNSLQIRVSPQSPEKPYIQAVRLNGRRIEGPVLRHSDLMQGGLLEFDMSDVPPSGTAGEQ